MDVIVITETLNDCIELHEYFGDYEFITKFKGQYPMRIEEYETTWYWWIDKDSKKLAGNSGHGALETAVRLNIGSRIYPIDDFLKLKIK